MSIEEIKIEILASIIEFYQNTEYYDKLMDCLNNGENIADLLKEEAIVYHIMMSNSRLVWQGESASEEYENYMSRYQRGYQLYLDFVNYFLGAKVVYPSLDYQLENGCSLVLNGVIDYRPFLESISVDTGRKLA